MATTTAGEYVDLLGGIAVNALGHAHPAVVDGRVTEQVATLGHVSNLFVAEPPVALAERLLRAGRPRPAGCSSATPAPRPTRPRSRSSRLHRPHATWSPPHGGFHGRTMGALALTGQPAKRDAVPAAARRRHARPVRRRRRRCAAAVDRRHRRW